MSNRIHTAWQQRHDVHQWLKTHIGSDMAAISAAFPDMVLDTLRKTLRRLCTDLNVVMVNGIGNVGRYSACTAEIKPLEHTLERLREGGRKNVKNAHTAWVKSRSGNPKRKRAAQQAKPKPAPVVQPKAQPSGPRIEIIAPGHIRVHPGAHPIRDQRGQGALRRTVHVDCSHNY